MNEIEMTTDEQGYILYDGLRSYIHLNDGTDLAISDSGQCWYRLRDNGVIGVLTSRQVRELIDEIGTWRRGNG